MQRVLQVYFDYKSPYAYLARDLIYGLADDFAVELDWRPYDLVIAEFLGTAEKGERGELLADARSERQWRKVKYLYMDCRRIARARRIEFHAPHKVFQSTVAHIGALFAKRHHMFRPYHDLVFDRFWRRALDIDSVPAIAGALGEAGIDAAGFEAFLAGEGRLELEQGRAEAHRLGIFGVPSFLLDGELFWGGEHIPQIRELLLASAPARP